MRGIAMLQLRVMAAAQWKESEFCAYYHVKIMLGVDGLQNCLSELEHART